MSSVQGPGSRRVNDPLVVRKCCWQMLVVTRISSRFAHPAAGGRSPRSPAMGDNEHD